MLTFSFQPNSSYFKICCPACPISSLFLYSTYVIELVLVLDMHVIFPLGAKQQSINQRNCFSDDDQHFVENYRVSCVQMTMVVLIKLTIVSLL